MADAVSWLKLYMAVSDGGAQTVSLVTLEEGHQGSPRLLTCLLCFDGAWMALPGHCLTAGRFTNVAFFLFFYCC